MLKSGSGKAIGDSRSPYVIAEIGTNHDGQIDEARRLIGAAAAAGCDCVKFQIYEADEIVSPLVRTADYGLEHLFGDISACEMFDKHLKTPKEWFPVLRDECRDVGLDCCVTVHGRAGASWAAATGFDLIKVASMDHTNTPLLEFLTTSVDVPVVASFGMAKLEDVDRAVDILRGHAAGAGLFHCVAIYPPDLTELNLKRISFYRERYEMPVGFSDHAKDPLPATVAFGLGACFFEKHITMDSSRPGPDHPFALEPEDLRCYVGAIRDCALAMGSDGVEPGERETINRTHYLKSIHFRRDMVADAVITPADVYCVRPGSGIAPGHMAEIVGCRLLHDVKAGMPLQWADIDRAQCR
jgi:sialic acid synthase SpsE